MVRVCHALSEGGEEAHCARPIARRGQRRHGPSEIPSKAAASGLGDRIEPGPRYRGGEQGVQGPGGVDGGGAHHVAAVERDRGVTGVEHLTAQPSTDVGPYHAWGVAVGGVGAKECPPWLPAAGITPNGQARTPVGEPSGGGGRQGAQRLPIDPMCPEDPEVGCMVGGWRRLAVYVGRLSNPFRSAPPDRFAAQCRAQQYAFDHPWSHGGVECRHGGRVIIVFDSVHQERGVAAALHPQ